MSIESQSSPDAMGESVFDAIPGLHATMEARIRAHGRDMQTMNPAWVEYCAQEGVRITRIMTGTTGAPNMMQAIDQSVAYCLDDEEMASWLEE